MSAPTFTTACEWFARCDNQTDRVATHPILGMVPCCDRCAEVTGTQTAQVPPELLREWND